MEYLILQAKVKIVKITNFFCLLRGAYTGHQMHADLNLVFYRRHLDVIS